MGRRSQTYALGIGIDTCHLTIRHAPAFSTSQTLMLQCHPIIWQIYPKCPPVTYQLHPTAGHTILYAIPKVSESIPSLNICITAGFYARLCPDRTLQNPANVDDGTSHTRQLAICQKSGASLCFIDRLYCSAHFHHIGSSDKNISGIT